MENKKRSLFPKNFFTKERKEATSKEALKDVVPLTYSIIDRKTTSNSNLKKVKKNIL